MRSIHINAITLSCEAMPNALANQTSPYLLQHANNPVDWMPWGPAALEKSRSENKLIFLSIGYAACHWCHVMEHESFEDDEVAAMLNGDFVPVKVDREERPDLDEIYMSATMLFTGGHGGWPMSVFLAPDLNPVFGGTYFPKEDAHGRPGFKTVLTILGQKWRDEPASLTADRDKILSAIRRIHKTGAARELPSEEDLQTAAAQAHRSFDMSLGGRASGQNKFPPSLAIDLLLRAWKNSGEAKLLGAVELTLEKMGEGGIYDHLGGGIHRYSTDPQWLVPHFEKMLYDQGLVVGAYLDGYQATSRDDLKRLFADRARGICEYVLRDLTSPNGGFYSSEDADSEGLEGKFYVWRRDQVESLLDEPVARIFCSHYDISEPGNWMHPGDAHVPAGPKNILQVVRPLETIAKLEGLELGEVESLVADARSTLLAERNTRIRPGLDDKILSGWNGLMITALARTAAVLHEPRFAEAAGRAADFVLDRMRVEGRLLAAYGKGKAHLTAYSTDYAFMIEGLLELFQTAGDLTRLRQAEELTEALLQHYWDESSGGFFFTADDHEDLLLRTKTAHDGATPSANSVMAGNLLRLAVLLDREDLRGRATKMLQVFGSGATHNPFQSERLFGGLDALRQGFVEIVLVGDDGTLSGEVQRRYLPNKIVVRLAAESESELPLLSGRKVLDGKPTAYVCRNFTCKQPTTDVAALAEQLDSA